MWMERACVSVWCMDGCVCNSLGNQPIIRWSQCGISRRIFSWAGPESDSYKRTIFWFVTPLLLLSTSWRGLRRPVNWGTFYDSISKMEDEWPWALLNYTSLLKCHFILQKTLFQTREYRGERRNVRRSFKNDSWKAKSETTEDSGKIR